MPRALLSVGRGVADPGLREGSAGALRTTSSVPGAAAASFQVVFGLPDLKVIRNPDGEFRNTHIVKTKTRAFYLAKRGSQPWLPWVKGVRGVLGAHPPTPPNPASFAYPPARTREETQSQVGEACPRSGTGEHVCGPPAPQGRLRSDSELSTLCPVLSVPRVRARACV